MTWQLRPNRDPHGIDDWFDVPDRGGTHLAGVAVLVVGQGYSEVASDT